MSSNDSIYYLLTENSRQNNDAFKQLNMQAINLFKSTEMMNAMRQYQKVCQEGIPNISRSITSLAEKLKNTLYGKSIMQDSAVKSLMALSASYKELIKAYEVTALSDTMHKMFEDLQLMSISQLCLSHETDMIRDMLSCFANAKYDLIPNVLNTAMTKPAIGAADIAFLKNGVIIPVIENSIKYPKGMKTSLNVLNHSTAEDIADNCSINYDTKRNLFCSSEGTVNSKTLNILSAGISVIGDELFTETELIDFISFLSQTPTLGGLQETGMKILKWISALYSTGIKTLDFDKPLYYHSRQRRRDEMPYTYDEMLKAPHGIPNAGRFNQVGRAHYYFADTRNGAEAEVKKHLKEDQEIQTIKISPIKSIKLLDLSGTLHRGKTFLRMIRYSITEGYSKMPKEYLLPCFVADCCRQIGFDGIKYYGSKDYNNYVSWSDGYFVSVGMYENEVV